MPTAVIDIKVHLTARSSVGEHCLCVDLGSLKLVLVEVRIVENRVLNRGTYEVRLLASDVLEGAVLQVAQLKRHVSQLDVVERDVGEFDIVEEVIVDQASVLHVAEVGIAGDVALGKVDFLLQFFDVFGEPDGEAVVSEIMKVGLLYKNKTKRNQKKARTES